MRWSCPVSVSLPVAFENAAGPPSLAAGTSSRRAVLSGWSDLLPLGGKVHVGIGLYGSCR
jgi:hypothetical protein